MNLYNSVKVKVMVTEKEMSVKTLLLGPIKVKVDIKIYMQDIDIDNVNWQRFSNQDIDYEKQYPLFGLRDGNNYAFGVLIRN